MSRQAIEAHYDVGDSFYELWLDLSLTYSCALWQEGDDLEAAQARKLDFMIALAGAAGADRVLDIGCGWGSALRRLVDHHGVGRAVGLTLSRKQLARVSSSVHPRIDVELMSWEDHAASEPYDAILCIGALEHFVRPGLPRREKVERYKAFFRRCNLLLRPGGRLSLQTIATGDAPLRGETVKDMFFIAREVFPDSNLPHLHELAAAMRTTFEVMELHNHREHYVKTCRAWRERLRRHRSEAVIVAGDATVARYERFLDASIRMFAGGHATLLRIGLVQVP